MGSVAGILLRQRFTPLFSPQRLTSGSVAGAKYKGNSKPFACFDSVVSMLFLPCPLWEGEVHTAPQTAYSLLKGGSYQRRPCLASGCASVHRYLPVSVFSAEFCHLPHTSSTNNPNFLTLVIALQDPGVATPSPTYRHLPPPTCDSLDFEPLRVTASTSLSH